MPAPIPTEAALEAQAARHDLGVGLDAPLADVLRLIEETARVPVAVVDFPPALAGMFRRRKEGPFIFLNGNQALVRKRFTLAHEYGHFRLGHRSVIDRDDDVFNTSAGQTQEIEANQFAGEFLAPRLAVMNWLDRNAAEVDLDLDVVVRLGRNFGVSAEAALFRIVDTGYLNRADTRALVKQIKLNDHLEVAAGLGLGEFQDSLAEIHEEGALPRTPSRMQQDARQAYKYGLLPVEEIAARLQRDPDTMTKDLAGITPVKDDALGF